MSDAQWPHPDDEWYVDFILGRYPDVVRETPDEIPRMVQLLKRSHEQRGVHSIQIKDSEGNVYLFAIESDGTNDFAISLTQQRS